MLITLTTGTLTSSTSPAFLCHDQLLIDRSPPAKSTPFAGAPPRGTLPTCPSSLTSAPPRSTRATADSLIGEPSTFPTPPIRFLPLRCRSSPPSPLAPGFRLAGISRCHQPAPPWTTPLSLWLGWQSGLNQPTNPAGLGASGQIRPSATVSFMIF
jgi:hypothetical protein